MSETAQAKEEEKGNEHLEEWLDTFSQKVEKKEAAALGSRRGKIASRSSSHSMGDGARDAGGLAKQSRASRRTGRS
jgi:hypothetical protein